tara:strand:- start:45805 stop:46545 length:741 start_codon:yes stop_codon:yes gene_type:complete
MEGKVVLITGAGSGLGQNHAVLLADRGANVIVQDINSDGVKETMSLVSGNSAKSYAIVCDVRATDEFTNQINDAMRDLGNVDVLVNNAGISSRQRSIEEIDDEILAEMFDVNVKGAYVATKAVLGGMKEKNWGRIINTASIFGMAGTGAGSHYCSAKAALIGLTKAWAKELAPWNILVNAVAPGFIPTPMTNTPGKEAIRAERNKTIPLGHEGEPNDISHAVAYFASEESKYVTGQVLSPNGGIVI